ncbi:hypothetical protein F0562_035663 [Nyssa sinensis]|uniref:Retrotransposon gag domain-containing protein n=1 Tax=Nyssa sinensis TaxID=561372 RepID=A0A5J5ADQ9_9ASTE|nr:hypothetical protein F0562_035663 [Nyssa sinensis]
MPASSQRACLCDKSKLCHRLAIRIIRKEIQLVKCGSFSPEENIYFVHRSVVGPISGIRAMASNKERIEALEAGLRGVQDGLHKMEVGMADRFHHLEGTINRLSDLLLVTQEPPLHGTHHREGHDGGRPVVSSKTAKLEFPLFTGDDPTEWFNRVNQFFEFQGTPEAHKVSLASYHLEGEANQWWQWIRRTFSEEGRHLSWADFEDELWARFGPSECEDFDEALSKIRQDGSLCDYQREFECLGN